MIKEFAQCKETIAKLESKAKNHDSEKAAMQKAY